MRLRRPRAALHSEKALTSPCLPTVPCAALALAAPWGANAQTAPIAPTPDVAGAGAATEVETVVVTANRSPAPISQVGQSVTVLTASQIRLDQETSVADILARTPGVVLTRNGGPGEATTLSIRGATTSQTVVLIDGVKVNDPSSTATGYDFANLITGDVWAFAPQGAASARAAKDTVARQGDFKAFSECRAARRRRSLTAPPPA